MVKPRFVDAASGVEHVVEWAPGRSTLRIARQGLLGAGVEIAIERRRLGCDRDRALDLARIGPERRGDLGDDDVALGDFAHCAGAGRARKRPT